MEFSRARDQQADGKDSTLAASCFGGVAGEVIQDLDLTLMSVSFYPGGLVHEVIGMDEFGRRQGWSLVYSSDTSGTKRRLLAAQQFEEGVAEGVHFFWESVGGRNLPYSFGVWNKGKPQSGVFKVGDEGLVSLANDGSYMVVDASPEVVLIAADGRHQVISFHGYDSLSGIKENPTVLRAFKELRGVGEYCSKLRVCKPPAQMGGRKVID